MAVTLYHGPNGLVHETGSQNYHGPRGLRQETTPESISISVPVLEISLSSAAPAVQGDLPKNISPDSGAISINSEAPSFTVGTTANLTITGFDIVVTLEAPTADIPFIDTVISPSSDGLEISSAGPAINQDGGTPGHLIATINAGPILSAALIDVDDKTAVTA